MNDIRKRHPHLEQNTVRSERKRASQNPLQKWWRGLLSWIKAHKKGVGISLLVLGLVGAGYGIYSYGYQQGQKAQKKADEKLIATRRDPFSQAVPNKWVTALGKVEAISGSEITIKPTSGESKKLAIDKETAITDSKGTRISAKDIKKGDQVSAFGTTKDGKATAQRIRLVVLPSSSPAPRR